MGWLIQNVGSQRWNWRWTLVGLTRGGLLLEGVGSYKIWTLIRCVLALVRGGWTLKDVGSQRWGGLLMEMDSC